MSGPSGNHPLMKRNFISKLLTRVIWITLVPLSLERFILIM
jgi:hypothetical protein